MIKLEAISTKFPKIMSATFYFHNMDDCNEFLYVFENHWCNVKWKKAIEIPDNTEIPEFEREDMDEDPKERAESNLSWGFSFAKDEGTDITTTQSAFVNMMTNRIIEGNK